MEKNTIQKDAEILISDFMERAQLAKTELCREERSDAPATLLVVFEPEQEGYEGDYEGLKEMCEEMGLSRVLQCGMIPLIHKPDVYDCLTDVISAFPADKFEYLFLACEGYVNKVEGTDLPKDYERGDMEKDYKENPFSQITEAMIIHGYDWNLSNRFMSVSHYGYGDDGLPKFTERHDHNDQPTNETEKGRLDELLYRAVQFLRLQKEATHYLSKWNKKKK